MMASRHQYSNNLNTRVGRQPAGPGLSGIAAKLSDLKRAQMTLNSELPAMELEPEAG